MTRIGRTVFTVSCTASLVVLTAGASARMAMNPDPPTNVIARFVPRTLTVLWTPPASGPAPTGYELDFFIGTTNVLELPVGPVNSLALPVPPGVQGQFYVTVTSFVDGFPSPPSNPAFFVIPGDAGCLFPPPTPTGLTGTLIGGNAQVRWDGATGADSYRLQAGRGQGLFDFFDGNVGNNTMAGASGLPPDFSAFLRVFSINDCGQSAPTPDFFLTGTPGPGPGTCVPGLNTLCLYNDRFKVETNWRTFDGQSGMGQVPADGRFTDGGRFYFFNPNNIELLVKVLNECATNNRYWVFASGLTNVEVSIHVTDTRAGQTKTYVNPLGQQFEPIQDTQAFATCP